MAQIRIDTSEVKTYRECKRKHQFSSRNRFHLRPVAPNDNFVFGTQFHELLGKMYMGTPLDKLLEWIDREVLDSVHWKVMTAMITGYYNGPYQKDAERFEVVDIERKFDIPLATVEELSEEYTLHKDDESHWYAETASGELHEVIVACGSIDMVCVDKYTNKLIGFEHKTTKNFRPEVYNIVDEQPRLYSWALEHILDELHEQGKLLDVKETGPIYLNQVKKLQTKFAYERVICIYDKNDLENFIYAFTKTCRDIATRTANVDALPEPGYMKCQMCEYAPICMMYGYGDINLDELKIEFDGEYEVRDHDHLDDKTSQHNDKEEKGNE